MSGDRPGILFVCVHNAGRSRMAAAWLDHLAGDRYRAASAGTDPALHPHPEVVDAMAEVGIVIPDEPGTLLTRELAGASACVVSMGLGVEEPALSGPLDEWGLPDPEGRPQGEVRVIRDTTRRLVERLIARLDTAASVRGDS